jgi:hypothetical protein
VSNHALLVGRREREKEKMKRIKSAAVALSLLVVFGNLGICQTNLNFNGVGSTVEGAIRLSWNSTSNEIYEVDYADELAGGDDGATVWNTLYEDYPAHGTNTFWLDTGNYFADPEVLHPNKMQMRFYRVVLTGTNTTTSKPIVSITSPTNGFDASGDITVTVTAHSDQSFLSTKLYVDGQEMNLANVSTNWTDSGTNYITDTYVINSSEWPNGSHTLFATARCQSGASGTHDAGEIAIGYGVSPYVPVTFDNLITRISFSQPFFAPEDGQTQQVSAVFAANVDWTLEIQDRDENTVRTVTGSGISMSFDWDGTGQGGTNLPVGNYTYLFTAQTNGQAFSMMSASSSSSSAEDFVQLWALSPESSGPPVPLALYPPGFDTSAFEIFEASQSEMRALTEAVLSLDKPAKVAKLEFESESGSGAEAAAAAAPSSQSSRAPTRPPINPVKGRAGVYGVAYQTYSANGTGYTLAPPRNGLPTQQRLLLEGKTTVAQSTFKYEPLKQYTRECANFVEAMKKGNWSQGFAKVDNALKIADLRGSGTIYNTVKLGLLMLHGTYGTSQDFTANGCQQMYFPITSGQSAEYLRMSEMNLGNSATNGLKWMAIAACNSLRQTQWQNMQNAGIKPYNNALHLLMGTDTVVWTDDHIMEKWAQYMTKGKGTNAPMMIKNAWLTAAKDAYAQSGFNYTNAIRFSYAGDTACTSDTLTTTNSTPGGTWTYHAEQVWPSVP